MILYIRNKCNDIVCYTISYYTILFKAYNMTTPIFVLKKQLSNVPSPVSTVLERELLSLPSPSNGLPQLLFV